MQNMFDLQGINIYLIGMMGSGKSTIGKLLADGLQYQFMDTDTTIEKKVSQNVTEIFEASGEIEFRQIETQVLAKITADTRLVVATGGGIAIELENWNHLRQGLVIWLDVSLDVLVERLKSDRTRPILNTPGDLRTKLQQILADRRERYAAANLHIPITSNLPPTEIVEQIINRLNSI
jgi:shikimate kinase